MKRLFIILMLVSLPNAYALPRQQRQNRQQQKLQPDNRSGVPPRRLMPDLVLAFYINRFQPQVDVSDEVFGKIVPLIRQFVQDRFDISQRRTRALNQIRQGIARGGSDDEIKRAIRDFDSADAEFQANQEKFLASVDPLLNARQQARLRVFQIMADNRMRQLVDEIQSGGQRPGQN
jgi:hypothetical protein